MQTQKCKKKGQFYKTSAISLYLQAFCYTCRLHIKPACSFHDGMGLGKVRLGKGTCLSLIPLPGMYWIHQSSKLDSLEKKCTMKPHCCSCVYRTMCIKLTSRYSMQKQPFLDGMFFRKILKIFTCVFKLEQICNTIWNKNLCNQYHVTWINIK